MSSNSDQLFVDAVTISDGEEAGEDTPPPPSGDSTLSEIVLDSEFDDWEGHANLPDPAGDATKTRGDILTLYWGDNGDNETLVFVATHRLVHGICGFVEATALHTET